MLRFLIHQSMLENDQVYTNSAIFGRNLSKIHVCNTNYTKLKVTCIDSFRKTKLKIVTRIACNL